MHYEAGDVVPFIVVFQNYDGEGAVPSDYAASKIKIARYSISAGTVSEITSGITITTLVGWAGVYFCKYTVPSSGNYAFLVRGETADTSIASQEVFTSFESGRAWIDGLSDIDTSSFTVVSPIAGSTISVYNHATMSVAITGLGDISGYTKIDFAVKEKTEDADASALIFIDGTSGLTYLNKAAAVTSAQGSITIDNASAGNITIFVHEAAMATLAKISGINYGVKGILTTGTDALAEGTINILGITPRAVS